MQNGVWFRFYPNGQLKSQDLFADGVLHGTSRAWRPDGTLYRETSYRYGLRHGEAWNFGPAGNPEQMFGFDKGKLICQVRYDERGRKSHKRY